MMSTVEVVVMTADLTIYREDISDIDVLPNEDILFLIVSVQTDDRPRLNGRRRLLELHGNDHYALLIRNGWVMGHGWDDGDFVWSRYQTDTPFKENVYPDHLPLATNAHQFNGGSVGTDPEDPLWLAALDLFQREMH